MTVFAVVRIVHTVASWGAVVHPIHDDEDGERLGRQIPVSLRRTSDQHHTGLDHSRRRVDPLTPAAQALLFTTSVITCYAPGWPNSPTQTHPPPPGYASQPVHARPPSTTSPTSRPDPDDHFPHLAAPIHCARSTKIINRIRKSQYNRHERSRLVRRLSRYVTTGRLCSTTELVNIYLYWLNFYPSP